MRYIWVTVIALICVFTIGDLSTVFASDSVQPLQADQNIETKQILVRVTQIINEGRESFGSDLISFQSLKIEVLTGEMTGESIELKNSEANFGISNVTYQNYKVGDEVKLQVTYDLNNQPIYSIEGHVKRYGLISLVILFVAVVVIVGRLWGVMSLLGLAISFGVIFRVILPLIINGTQPVLAAILGACLIVPTTFYISHGINRKTHVGVISTVIGLIITGFLSVYFVNATYLTGFSSEEAGFLAVEKQGSVNIRGLLLAGIIIGVLGILDDVTIGQASSVQQLKEADPTMNWRQLFHHGMEVGQDHVSSMVNTLVLVYSGSALPLLLLFVTSDRSFLEIIELEIMAEEIVRMLVGSIGLVLVAPLSTLLAAIAFSHHKT